MRGLEKKWMGKGHSQSEQHTDFATTSFSRPAKPEAALQTALSLADPGNARGGSTNTSDTNELNNSFSDDL